MKIEKQSINLITAILFFLMALNFLNIFYIIVIILFFQVVFFSTHSNFHDSRLILNTILVFIFCLFYCLTAPKEMMYGVNAYIKIFSYFLGYIIGRKVIHRGTTNVNLLIIYIIVLALGSALLGVLTLIKNLILYGVYGFNRIMPGFWTDNLYGATSQSSLFLLFSGTALYVLFILKKQYFLKAVCILGIIMLILNALLNASRTALVYPIVVFLVSYLSYLLFMHKIKLKNFLILIFLVLIFFGLFQSNFLGFNNFVAELPLIKRINNPDLSSLSEDPRIGSYKFFVNHMADYPFGGLNKINPIKYMHNLWLDVYAVSGIYAFIFSILFTGSMFINSTRIIRHSKVEVEFKIFLTGIYLSFFLLFMSEPVLLANPWYFIIFCVVGGMCDKYLDNVRLASYNRSI